MTDIVQRSVSFYGDNLAVIRHDGEDYTPVKPICEILGIDWEAQRQRIERDDVLSRGACVLHAPSAGGIQQTTCLPLKMLNGWLFGISSGHIRPESRESLIRYKLECYDALARAFGVSIPAASAGEMIDLEARVARIERRLGMNRPAHLRVTTIVPPVECESPSPSLPPPPPTQEQIIIDAIRHRQQAMTHAEVVSATGFPKSSAYVALMRLVRAGQLRRVSYRGEITVRYELVEEFPQ
jgi:hypothetical protein